MPKLQAVVTTRTEVDLKGRLATQLKERLIDYYRRVRESKALAKDIAKDKSDLELMFADSGQYAALEEGVRVSTPFGEVPLKIIIGKTSPRLNMAKLKKLIIKLGGTEKQLAACYDPAKDKKPYLGVFLPREADDTDDEGDDE